MTDKRIEPGVSRCDAANLFVGRGYGPAILVLCGGLMLWMSWGRSADALVDFGGQLYVAWRLSEGDQLYRDIAYLYGPFSPWFNSVWFRLIGPGLVHLLLVNGVVLIGIVFMLYRLLRRCGDAFSATAACLVFLTLFAFSQYVGVANYNYLAPYAHEATHGMILALLCITLLSGTTRAAVPVSGCLLGLAFLTKPELFAAALPPAAWFLLHGESWQSGLRRAATCGAALAGTVIITGVVLSMQVGTAAAVNGIAAGWPDILSGRFSALPFYRSLAGFDEPFRNGAIVLGSALLILLLLLPGWWVSTRAPHTAPPHGAPWIALGLSLVASLVVLTLLPWQTLWLPLPLLLAALLGMQFADRDGDPEQRRIRIGLLLFALALLPKILLRARIHHYGFALAMPGVLVLVAAGTSWLPEALARRGGQGTILRASVIGVLLAVVPVHVACSAAWFRYAGVPVGQAPDRLLTDPVRGDAVNETLAFIRAHTAPSETVLVLPSGIMLNYLTRRRTASPYMNFMPPERLMFGEQRMLAAIELAPPDRVVLIRAGPGEFESSYAGDDFWTPLMDWVRTHYALALRSGGAPTDPETHFGIDLMEPRRDDEPHAE